MRPRTQPVPEEEPAPIVTTNEKSHNMALIEQLCEELSLAIVPKMNLLTDLAQQISSRMTARRGTSLYQNVAFDLPNFPPSLAREIFPPERLITESETTLTWRWEEGDFASMETTITHLFNCMSANTSAGMSHALKTESEKFVRSIATMMPPLEISWVHLRRGVDRLYVNYFYVLWDQWGALHPPKDNQRREMTISDELTGNLRTRAWLDANDLSMMGCPLSPSWLRMLGRDSHATRLECITDALSAGPPLANPRKRKRVAKWDAERVRDQRVHEDAGTRARDRDGALRRRARPLLALPPQPHPAPDRRGHAGGVQSVPA